MELFILVYVTDFKRIIFLKAKSGIKTYIKQF